MGISNFLNWGSNGTCMPIFPVVCRPGLLETHPLVGTFLKISWAPGPYSKRARGGLVSIDKKAIEIKRMSTPSILHQTWAPQPAVVSGTGSSSSGLTVPTRSAGDGGSGDQPTLAEPPNMLGQESTSGDAVPPSPGADVCVGRLQVADAEAWEWVSVRATRGFMGRQGKHSVEMEVTPVGTRRRRAVGSIKSSRSEDRNTLRCMTHKARPALGVASFVRFGNPILYCCVLLVTRAQHARHRQWTWQSSMVAFSMSQGSFPSPHPISAVESEMSTVCLSYLRPKPNAVFAEYYPHQGKGWVKGFSGSKQLFRPLN